MATTTTGDDITFSFDDKTTLTLPRSKVLATSPVLAAMFGGGFAEGRASDIHVESVQSAVFRLLFTADKDAANAVASLNAEQLRDLMELAHQYGLATLAGLTADKLLAHVQQSWPDNRARYWDKPMVLNLEALLRAGKTPLPSANQTSLPQILGDAKFVAELCSLRAELTLQMAVQGVSYTPHSDIWALVIHYDWPTGLARLLDWRRRDFTLTASVLVPEAFQRNYDYCRYNTLAEFVFAKSRSVGIMRVLAPCFADMPPATFGSLFATDSAGAGVLLHYKRGIAELWVQCLRRGRIDCLNLMSLMHAKSSAADFAAQLCTAGEASGDTLLLVAVRLGFGVVCRWLLAHGAAAAIDHRNRSGETALFCAVAANNRPLVELLLERRADPNVACQGSFALTHAAGAGNYALVALLLDHGANPDLVNSYGKTAAAELIVPSFKYPAAAVPADAALAAQRAQVLDRLQAASLAPHMPRSAYAVAFLDELRIAHNASAPAGDQVETVEAFYERLAPAARTLSTAAA